MFNLRMSERTRFRRYDQRTRWKKRHSGGVFVSKPREGRDGKGKEGEENEDC